MPANLRQFWIGVTRDNPNSGPTGALLLAGTDTVSTASNASAPGISFGAATKALGGCRP